MTTDAEILNTVAQPAVEPAEPGKPGKPDMVLTGGKAGRVRKSDVIVVKHYLHAEEITQSNRIAAMFLDDAEDRASQRQDLRMDDWRQYVDRFVAFNERPLLKDAGTVSHERMQQIAHERYAVFDAKRRKAEALAADVEDIGALESIENWRAREAIVLPNEKSNVMQKNALSCSIGKVACGLLPAFHSALTKAPQKSCKEGADAT
ncbi:RhuM family protein [Xanthomonas arboricola]|uniref:RhuM family protein n=1 Tax=Xanthomonas arboricola TaxID=56448 RepID=UPI001F0B66E8|nr:RhuM family protein [Xanthomonas arboricola]